MTPGQNLAVYQLGEVAAAGVDRTLEIERVINPNGSDPRVRVFIRVRIGSVAEVGTGLHLREWEQFMLLIPPRFPFQRPDVIVLHNRFAGKPHVQWIHHLCLYQSSSEWNPSDGIFGLLDRLEYWLKQGALDQLDPIGEPLHPPAVYADYAVGKIVVPRENTPQFDSAFWLGVVQTIEHSERIELGAWHSLDNVPPDGKCAIALLFSSPLPWEYPTNVAEFFRESERQGVGSEYLFRILKLASLFTDPGQPIYLVLGSPMRGVAGGLRRQHLSVWAIESQMSDYIRNTVGNWTDTNELSVLRENFESLLKDHLAQSKLSWCRVLEARPEVTERRDRSAPIQFFRGKAVSIWGCGALGAYVALSLCRAGVRKLVLRDYGIVTPGILVRQPYMADDIGKLKIDALKSQLLLIRPDIEIETIQSNIETDLSKQDFDLSNGSDFIIDATAADLVRRRLEMVWNRTSKRVLISALMLDNEAKRLITVVVGPENSGAAWDTFRNTKLMLLKDSTYVEFSNAFFPAKQKGNLFQPEPGCSEPTFIGSNADSTALAGIGLNLIAQDAAIVAKDAAISHVFAQPASGQAHSSAFNFEKGIVVQTGDFEIRLSQAAKREMIAWVLQNRRLRGGKVETGGLLWGEWDDATRIIWVTDASGPPTDSSHSETLFICGTNGTLNEHNVRTQNSRLATGYIGMWHTHPASRPMPSEIDIQGMNQILTAGELSPRRNILLIIGKESNRASIGAYIFRRTRNSGGATIYPLGQGRIYLTEDFL